jgi:hypothetical protein
MAIVAIIFNKLNLSIFIYFHLYLAYKDLKIQNYLFSIKSRQSGSSSNLGKYSQHFIVDKYLDISYINSLFFDNQKIVLYLKVMINNYLR